MNVTLLKNSKAKQQGAVLVVAMVILLVMSVIGISTLTSSTMQERMAGNNRQRSLAQSAAEAALKDAEAFLVANINSVDKLSQFDGTNGLYSAVYLPSAGVDRNPLSDDIPNIEDDSQWLIDITRQTSVLSSNVKSVDPRYVIEYYGQEAPPSTNSLFIVDNTAADTQSHIFVITAIGWGIDSNIYTVLQSTFRTGNVDFGG